MPPEVYGCLSVAQRHLALSRRPWRFRGKDRSRKHYEKVQKLVAKAVRYLGDREIK